MPDLLYLDTSTRFENGRSCLAQRYFLKSLHVRELFSAPVGGPRTLRRILSSAPEEL